MLTDNRATIAAMRTSAGQATPAFLQIGELHGGDFGLRTHEEQEASLRTFAGDTISIRYVESFFGKALARALLRDAGLADDAGSPPALVKHRDFWQLCLRNINMSGDEGHGCTPRPIAKSTWQMIFSAVNQMDTLSDGLRQFAELVPAVCAGMAVTVGYGRNGVHLNYMVEPSAVAPSEVARLERYVELIALVFHCVLLWVTDHQLEPVQIRLSANLDEADGSLLSGLSASTARQGRGVTIVYDRDDMDLPLGVRKYQHWSNETKAFEDLCLTARPVRARDGLSPVVAKVRDLIATRTLTLQEVAPMLGMSIATLQRRLREAGTSFRMVSRDVRCEKLLSLLATDIHFDDVAEELGLSERRSLWRTCQEWLGVSPSEYRRNQRSANAARAVSA
ncbi:hypothetical protein ASE00_06650 [Sphingomonas sp. Root710]|uniref:helix-turn-helix domain-containing protein n=1 Tax=Sphingomonas sp. Root710 TaxID=1736594 RepID=UPI0006FED522|nr:AraC family transcriptional regulator [Sphingomonas sp. Root710]KRB86384.1 hypothetical protein ASE00_06650 [Sphingomonas sp. Root710]